MLARLLGQVVMRCGLLALGDQMVRRTTASDGFPANDAGLLVGRSIDGLLLRILLLQLYLLLVCIRCLALLVERLLDTLVLNLIRG